MDLLSSSHKDLPERHRSLRALFESSWVLLSPQEADVLAKLSVFRGGFQRQAAQDIAGANVRTLLSLVNQSWLSQSQQGRYAQHMLVQQFTLEKLESSQDLCRETKLQHLTYFVNLAEQSEGHLRGEDQAVWLQLLNDDYANLQAALEYAQTHHRTSFMRLTAALWQFWWHSGRIREGRQWLNKGLAGSNDKEIDILNAKNHYAAGYLAWLQGDYASTDKHCQNSLNHYQHLNDNYGIAITLDVLGMNAYELGDFELSKTLYEQSLDILTSLGETYRATAVRSNLAHLLIYMDDVATAQAMQEENLRVTERIGDHFGHGLAANVLGMMMIEQNKLAEAKGLLLKSLEIKQQQNDFWGIAFSLEYIAHLFLKTHQLCEAAQLLGAAESLRKDLNSPVPPNEQARHQEDVAQLKADLDEAVFLETWEKGRERGLEQTLEIVLDHLSQART